MSNENWVKKIKAVGFDLDGTLYRSNPELSAWFGKKLEKTVADHVGKNVEEIKDEFYKRKEKFGSTTLTLNSFGLNGEEVFQKLFDEAPLERYVLPDRKLAEMLERLDRGYEIFLISNGTEHQIRRKLRLLEIDEEMFEPFIGCYDHKGWVKPNPGAFLYTLDELDFESEEVLFVGDRVDTDIEGARGVGIKTCIVWGESEMADVSLETIYELEEFLEV